MPRQPKILKYELAEFVMDQRERGRSNGQVAAAVNDELAHRGVKDKVDKRTIERHFATLDIASVPYAHTPPTAARNAAAAFNIADRLGLLDEKVVKWIEQADLACKQVPGVVYDVLHQRITTPEALGAERQGDEDGFDFSVADPDHPIVQVYEIDWQARAAMSRELRELSKVVADLLQRVHDAGQVQAFQQSVEEAISEASPEVANRVLEKMAAKQSIARAQLMGIPATTTVSPNHT